MGLPLSLAGSVVATMEPAEEVPAQYGWGFPTVLAVQDVQVRRFDHVELVQLLDAEHRVLATLLLPLSDIEDLT